MRTLRMTLRQATCPRLCRKENWSYFLFLGIPTCRSSFEYTTYSIGTRTGTGTGTGCNACVTYTAHRTDAFRGT